jgi:hypothetical protein
MKCAACNPISLETSSQLERGSKGGKKMPDEKQIQEALTAPLAALEDIIRGSA